MTDLRYAVRSLLHARRFTAAAVVTFALGIGINVAVFSAVDRMLFRPLPYPGLDHIAVMAQFDRGSSKPGTTLPKIFIVAARRLRSIESVTLAGFTGPFSTTRDPNNEGPVYLTAMSYSAADVLGVRTVGGRVFSEADARDERGSALIRYETWQTRFGGTEEILGRHFWAGSHQVEVVGVLPPGFIAPPVIAFDPRSDGLYLDFDRLTTASGDERERTYPPLVRIRPGVSMEAAAAEFAGLEAGLRSNMPVLTARGASIKLVPMTSVLFSAYRNYLVVVLSAGALVLLVACANLASLLLVRGRSREREAAIRAALGATPAQIITGALLESVVVCVFGGVAALIVLAWTLPALMAVLPPVFGHYSASVIDLRVLAFAGAVTGVSAGVAGVVPGWRLARVDLLPVLQRNTASGRRRVLGSSTVIALEAALGVVLVVAAALAVRSFAGLVRTDLNFVPKGLYAVNLRQTQKDAGASYEVYRQALEVIRQQPGVVAAAGADGAIPVTSTRPFLFSSEHPVCCRWRITEGLFETLGTPLVAGRFISESDVRTNAGVAMLNVSGARLVWPDADPATAVGRTLHLADDMPRAVVGVVADIRPSPTRAADPGLFVPSTSESGFTWMEFAVRMAPGRAPDFAGMLARIRERVGGSGTLGIDSDADHVENALRDPRFRAALFGTFALIALLLAAVGLYAVAAFDVAARHHEMGVRLMLGAAPGQIERLILRDACRPVLAGTAAGLVGAWWAAQFLQAFLFKVDARDPGTYAIVAVVLVVTAIAAAWLPARRAARLDPAVVLRAS